MNFGSSGNPTTPNGGGTYYGGSSYNPYSPLSSAASYQQQQPPPSFGYSPTSSWPPPPEDAKSGGGGVLYNGGTPYSDSEYRPPSEELKPPSEDAKDGLLHDVEATSSSSPANSSSHKEDSSPQDEDKKAFSSSLLLSDLSKFDDKHQQELLSNNNNDDYTHLGAPEHQDKALSPYDVHPPHEDWLSAASNQHLQGGLTANHAGFPLGMGTGGGAYGQTPPPPPQQQPMWNYYHPSNSPSSYPPHNDRFMETPWWNYGPVNAAPWAAATGPIRSPRPSPRGTASERRGPGRPRLSSSNKGSPPVGSPASPGGSRISPLGGYTPYPGGGESEDEARKRGPGRPRIGLSPEEGGNILEELGGGPPQQPPPQQPPVNTPTGSSGGGSSSSKSKGSSTSTNSNKKRYVCEICQKRFSTAWYVRVHRKSHNGERPYICHNCGKGFMLPNVLQVHLRKCEKNNAAGNLRPEASRQKPPQPPLGEAQIGGNLGEASSGSPLPQHNVPYDIYGGLYNNQRFQPPNEPSLSCYTTNSNSMLAQQPEVHHASQPTHYESIPGGFPNDRSSTTGASPYGSPLFSPPAHHFLANDRPPDKGGGDLPPPPVALHETELPGSLLPCSACDKTFSERGEREAHALSSHGTCPVCSEAFPFKSSLLSHIQRNHEKFFLENHHLANELKDNIPTPSASTESNNSIHLSEDPENGAKLQQQTPLAMS